jgi:hypothetical protein
MNDGMTREALELMARMVAWEMRDQLSGDVGDLVHHPEPFRSEWIEWTVQTGVGGPVRISHDVFPLSRCTAEQLAEAASALVDTAVEAKRHGKDRAVYEARMTRVARSLLRRKAAAGIRLIGVVSSTIPTNWYQDIGVDVTFEWAELGCACRDTLQAGSEEELRDAFEDMLYRIGDTEYQTAA